MLTGRNLLWLYAIFLLCGLVGVANASEEDEGEEGDSETGPCDVPISIAEAHGVDLRYMQGGTGSYYWRPHQDCPNSDMVWEERWINNQVDSTHSYRSGLPWYYWSQQNQLLVPKDPSQGIYYSAFSIYSGSILRGWYQQSVGTNDGRISTLPR